MKKTLLLITLFTMILNQKIYGQERYIDNVFSSVEVEENVVYGNNISVFSLILGMMPASQDLIMDIYTPEGDCGWESTNRPAVILLHTGSFLPPILNGQATGAKNDNSIVEQCMQFAKKGYVAIALS